MATYTRTTRTWSTILHTLLAASAISENFASAENATIPPALAAPTAPPPVTNDEYVERYFELLEEYFDIDLDEITTNMGGTTGQADDQFSCLRRQRRAGPDGWFHASEAKERVVIELLGVEGSGHHAIHELINKETDNNHISWTGAR